MSILVESHGKSRHRHTVSLDFGSLTKLLHHLSHFIHSQWCQCMWCSFSSFQFYFFSFLNGSVWCICYIYLGQYLVWLCIIFDHMMPLLIMVNYGFSCIAPISRESHHYTCLHILPLLLSVLAALSSIYACDLQIMLAISCLVLMGIRFP